MIKNANLGPLKLDMHPDTHSVNLASPPITTDPVAREVAYPQSNFFPTHLYL